jgi:hypothetical protein
LYFVSQRESNNVVHDEAGEEDDPAKQKRSQQRLEETKTG